MSILDLSAAGHQPMFDATSRFVISYNGEVYNYRDLQAYLVHTHGPIAWKSGTDTEVIIEGFAREGLSFLSRLNGIFAIAIYDNAERTLHVLRDPLGIKPLFFTQQGGATFFCSELKGLRALPDLTWTLRREALADQLAFMYVPEPHTLYREFFKVEPGVCLTYRDGKQVGEQALFGHLREPLELSSENEIVERLQASFATAVQRQLVSDVPVSLFLSGGLDSSAIAQQAVRGGANIRDAYTIAYSAADRSVDSQSDDLYFATMIAQKLGLHLHVIEARRDQIDMLPDMMEFMEDGFTDPAAINTYQISAAARRAGCKVMLTGQGADEYLVGYRRHQAERILGNVPAFSRPILASLGRVAAAGLPKRMNGPRRRLARFAHLAEQSPKARLLSAFTWTRPETIKALLAAPDDWTGGTAFTSIFESYETTDTLNAMMRADQLHELISLNLCYTDRMSMAVGVEARVPFLDFELVRLMNAIPLRYKLKGRHGKYIFKQAMEPFLPREIIYREKAGFGLPIRAWLNDRNSLLNEYFDESRLRRQGIFNPAEVRRLMQERTSGSADHAYTIVTLLCQQLWLDRYVG